MSCQNNFDHNLTIDFDKSKYNENSTFLKRILLNVNDSVCTYRICNKCNSSLLQHCLVKCTLCDKEVKKFSASRYNTNVESVLTDLCTEPTKWICKECDSKISGEIKLLFVIEVIQNTTPLN